MTDSGHDAPVEPRIVAEVGPLVVLVDRDTGPLATLAFVIGVSAGVFGGFGAVQAPLDQVRMQTRTQLASSSPAPVATTPPGTRILKRGNPFNGGIGDLQTILTALLVGHPH